MRDQRSITVGAPPDGERAAPPPRRAPHVVDPPTDPPTAPGAPAESGPAGVGSEPTAASPEVTTVGAVPAAGGDAAPRAREQRRVVVPAPDGTEPRRAAPAPTGGAGRGGPPPPAAAGTPAPRRRRRYLPSKRVVAAIALVLLVLVGGTLLWAYAKFNSIDTVDLSAVLASGDGTNYLIVGSDTREGVGSDDPNAAVILGDDSVNSPERSDTILILRVDDAGARMLSVPRDLFVTISGTGQRGRINGAFNDGPAQLIATLSDQLDLPVHHYLEVDFVSFAGVVDALGGVTIDFEHPAFDRNSGLDVPEAGPQTLDGDEALAYVRSRAYTEVVDGREVPDPTGDIGRTERQQQFLSAVIEAVGSERNPFVLRSVADELSTGMRIDSDLGFLESLNLLRRMRGLDPAPTSLPTFNFQTSAGAAVLGLEQPGADEVLAEFGSSGSRIE